MSRKLLIINMVDLGNFSNTDFYHGRNVFIRALWILVSILFFQTNFPYPSRFKSLLLRLFGAKIGSGLVVRSRVVIKQPWKLQLGDYVWIGEGVWIDNLVSVLIESNVCISQGAFLLTGNHNYRKSSFDLITGEIILEDGVWIGAKAIVGPGVICHSHSVLSAGSTAFQNLDRYGIYQGNPATIKRIRTIEIKK
jgi:putative colanic acid biosynthesis acetyltransferase WcaF